jgi:hypothetical protein
MSRGQWIVSSRHGKVNHPEVRALLTDCLYYSPPAHTPDRLAAECFARWGAKPGEIVVESGWTRCSGERHGATGSTRL